MDINLTADLADFVDRQVREGRYQEASDVVGAALRQFQLRGVTGSSGIPPGADIEALAFTVLDANTAHAIV